MITITNNLMSTCWHEAGHAVTSLAQGLIVTKLEVADSGDEGCCTGLYPSMYCIESGRELRTIARASIISDYAGIEAERLYNPNASEDGASGDFAKAMEKSREFGVFPRGCNYVGDDVHEAYLHRLRLQARRLVRRHRDSIRHVAERLAHKRVLSEVEIKVLWDGMFAPAP